MSSPNESPCPDCGEMVRINSVRCWNCGAFMNRELEAKFLQMQANPAPIIFSQIPDADLESVSAEESSGGNVDEEDDFELAVPASRSDGPGLQVVQSAPAQPSSPVPAAVEAKATEAPAPAAAASVNEEDALLNIALRDELEARQRRAKRKVAGVRTVGGGFVIFCPYGCKIEVKEDHRGKQGRCPKCRAPFIVPIDPPMYRADAVPAETVAAGPVAAGNFAEWLTDLRVHPVNLEKLKLKADSLAKEFFEADFAFGAEQLIVLELAKKAGGLFGGGGAKKPEVRTAAQQHLREGKPLEELAVNQKFTFTKEQVSDLNVVQPAPAKGLSVFHGIPVFGEGRIAIQLPAVPGAKDPLYVSLGITQFWGLSKALQNVYGISGLGADSGIPAAPVYKQVECHYLKSPIQSLEDLNYYKADPTVELEVTGYRCGACGLTVSEAGRAKESLGGKSPKGIAKAKCPKCQQKMGENLLYALKAKEAAPTEAPTAAT